MWWVFFKLFMFSCKFLKSEIKGIIKTVLFTRVMDEYRWCHHHELSHTLVRTFIWFPLMPIGPVPDSRQMIIAVNKSSWLKLHRRSNPPTGNPLGAPVNYGNPEAQLNWLRRFWPAVSKWELSMRRHIKEWTTSWPTHPLKHTHTHTDLTVSSDWETF